MREGRAGRSELRLRQAAVRQVATGETHDWQARYWQARCAHTSHLGGGRHDRRLGGAVRSVHPSRARGADRHPLRHRRRHRPERDGDGHLSRLDAEERAQGLRQGLYRRHDLHARHARSRHAARRRPGRHGDAVVCGLRHLRDQEHRARRHDHRVRQLPGRPRRVCPEHVFRAQGFAHNLDAGSQGQEGRRQRLRLRRRSGACGSSSRRTASTRART